MAATDTRLPDPPKFLVAVTPVRTPIVSCRCRVEFPHRGELHSGRLSQVSSIRKIQKGVLQGTHELPLYLNNDRGDFQLPATECIHECVDDAWIEICA